MAAYDFADPHFISINRTGRLADRQRRVLVWSAGLPLAVVSFVGLIAGCGVIAAPLFLAASAIENLGSPFGLLVAAALVVMPCLGSIALAVYIGSLLLKLFHAVMGEVTQVEGRLVWRGNRYRGVTDAGVFDLVERRLELPPGSYRFYVVKGSRAIVGGERLVLGDLAGEPSAEVRRALQGAFDFDDQDLIANRNLMLSDGQKRRRMTAGLLNSALVFGLLGAPIVLTPLAFLVLGSPWEALGGFLGFIPCLCALPVFALGVLFLTQWPYVSDLNAGRLETIEGKLTEREVVSHSNRTTTRHFYYVIDGQRFVTNYAANQASLQGEVYRLYYLPRSRRVVSAEPVT